MHMADALISPIVGGAMWAGTIALTGVAVKKIRTEIDDKKIPLMGVMGAFIFAAQMINFSIPGTGSSGHLGGGLILTILLGPWAGFLVMSSVLAIQALFFADGGLLAYGCNVVNLGFFTSFIAYPFIYKKIARQKASFPRQAVAAIFAAIVGLQLGSFAVVLETLLSGKTELPFVTFTLLMQPIHLAVGLVEGIVTAAVIAYVRKTSPTLLDRTSVAVPFSAIPVKKVIITMAIATILAGAVFVWFASSDSDGLEWAIEKTASGSELETKSVVHTVAADIQKSTAILPDYSFKDTQSTVKASTTWPSINAGTSVSAIVGSALTLLLAVLVGFTIRFIIRRGKKSE